jgi:hypothetical protein
MANSISSQLTANQHDTCVAHTCYAFNGANSDIESATACTTSHKYDIKNSNEALLHYVHVPVSRPPAVFCDMMQAVTVTLVWFTATEEVGPIDTYTPPPTPSSSAESKQNTVNEYTINHSSDS